MAGPAALEPLQPSWVADLAAAGPAQRSFKAVRSAITEHSGGQFPGLVGLFQAKR
jgi:hypothetical protein